MSDLFGSHGVRSTIETRLLGLADDFQQQVKKRLDVIVCRLMAFGAAKKLDDAVLKGLAIERVKELVVKQFEGVVKAFSTLEHVSQQRQGSVVVRVIEQPVQGILLGPVYPTGGGEGPRQGAQRGQVVAVGIISGLEDWDRFYGLVAA